MQIAYNNGNVVQTDKVAQTNGALHTVGADRVLYREQIGTLDPEVREMDRDLIFNGLFFHCSFIVLSLFRYSLRTRVADDQDESHFIKGVKVIYSYEKSAPLGSSVASCVWPAVLHRVCGLQCCIVCVACSAVFILAS